MKQFEYGGHQGEKVLCGSIEAVSPEQARQLLREQGIVVLQMKEKKSWRFFKRGFSARQRALFTRQLATLLDSSVPLSDALSCIAEQSDDSRLVQLSLSLKHVIESGESFSDACRQHESMLGPLFASMVKAGETSSQLVEVLLALADYTEQQSRLTQQLQQALLYPLIMTVVAVGIVFFLLWRVVPMMILALQESHQSLPWPTVLLMHVSQWCQSYGGVSLLAVMLVFFYISRYHSRYLRQCIMRFPGVKSFVILANTTRFIRALSVLQAARVPLSSALPTASLLIQWETLKDRMTSVSEHIHAGGSLSTALEAAGFFSPMCVQMVRCGEKTGDLSSALDRVAQWQSDQVTQQLKRYITLFEPMLILCMGAIVLFIVLSVMLPIFSMDQLSGMS